MIETIVTALSFVLFAGFLNRHRGGGPVRINHMIEKVTGWRPRALHTAAVFMLLPATFLYMWQFLGAEMLSSLYFSLLTILTWFLWGLNGWGSYMEIGRNQNGYKDRVEVAWIDWILYWVHGPKWIPKADKTTKERKTAWNWKELFSVVPLGFGFTPPDVVNSPDGKRRSLGWRQRRDWTGMTLRGTHSVWFFVFASIWFGNWDLMWLIVPFSLVFGWIYKFCYSDKFMGWWNRQSWKNKVIFKDNLYFSEDFTPHTFAEWGAGLLWGVTILATIYLHPYSII